MNNKKFKNFRLVTEASGNKTVLMDENNKMLGLVLESYYAEVEKYIENILKSMYGDNIKFDIKRDLDGIYINAKNNITPVCGTSHGILSRMPDKTEKTRLLRIEFIIQIYKISFDARFFISLRPYV